MDLDNSCRLEKCDRHDPAALGEISLRRERVEISLRAGARAGARGLVAEHWTLEYKFREDTTDPATPTNQIAAGMPGGVASGFWELWHITSVPHVEGEDAAAAGVGAAAAAAAAAASEGSGGLRSGNCAGTCPTCVQPRWPGHRRA